MYRRIIENSSGTITPKMIDEMTIDQIYLLLTDSKADEISTEEALEMTAEYRRKAGTL